MGKYISVYSINSTGVLDDLEIYKLVLSGKVGKFPNSFWDKPWSLESAKVLTIYAIETILKLDQNGILRMNRNDFKSIKLYGMLADVFHYNIYEAINNAYPQKYKPWQFNKVTHKYWTPITTKEATEWLLTLKSETEGFDLRKLTSDDFRKNNIDGAMRKIYKWNIFKAIDDIYPGRYKEWEFPHVSKNYWNEDKAKEATRWLVLTKLGLTPKDIALVTSQDFIDNGLSYVMYKIFNGKEDALNKAFEVE